MISQNKINQIKQLFSKEPVEVVYVFGSHAGGRVHPESDYDFSVLFSDTLSIHQRFDKRLDYMGKIGMILGSDHVDVVDLNAAPPLLRYSALAPRMDIYTRDESKRIDFETRVLREYFDEFPYIRRHTHASLATMAREGLSL